MPVKVMTRKGSGRPGEFELIERFFAPLSGRNSFGLRDDAALLEFSADSRIAVTVDAIAEGVHFLPGTDPALVARKAIRVNLSDLAAKGAQPFAILLSLGLPEDWDESWMEAFASGLAADCREFGLDLAGGDTWRSPGGAVVSVTAFGRIAEGNYATRLAAGEGDMVFVTGSIGDAALGLAIAREGDGELDEDRAWLRERYLLPLPRVGAAGLIARYASAAMDVSDGLAGDLVKMLRASGVSMRLAANNVPASQQALRYLSRRDGCPAEKALEMRLTGGDDYELLIAVPAGRVDDFRKEAAHLPFPVTGLGHLDPGDGTMTIIGSDGEVLDYGNLSYAHFGESD